MTSSPATPPAAPTPAATPPVVEFKQVTKTYDTGHTAIKDVTFRVDDVPGHMEIVGILGPSGCGKSTVLRLIAGLSPQHPATSGTVEVMGRAVSEPGADRGFVFQDYTSFDNRTVEENIAFGLECRGMGSAERLDMARGWIEKVGLDVKRDATKYPHELSGGMRQRVALARTLILKPRVILMDEPFGALDPKTRYAMQDQLVALSREVQATVFLVTHSIEEAVYVGDRIFIFSNAPGTILKEMHVPAPVRPARVMQREPEFLDIVFEVRDIVEGLEMSNRAGT
ncbi:MAG: ABC transporter ATP-binding protein [Gemmatimonadetes bacterium]|jgi:NitT/TauT family transport system ATP-binding protein|nr:ABC transporter ATP-binding protein [Gemmatimonadota bacterium]MBK6454502.1 ABC transporter ATP-binding protein [Gemmatimonadota bacterium]MBK8646814.1 ABC transporter ATP-binding protein [Gemmatimonadota bacterium]MBK9980056.1 ABC transporter ATP-binding protein [Gemmatimonadota bacterium]HNV75184.1 ABC transporter ATP-binding protein [Gemmatimonadaceae bacterium]